MLRAFKKHPDQAVLDRVRDWTRARFSLSGDTTILVTELACMLPGCAPIETVVAFWTAADKRHHFKIFKPVVEVVEDDLPPAWMMNALIDIEGFGCPCC
jgi:nitrate reductase delta subunit